jgi:hypothetical protein
MKILFHSNQLGIRGTEVALFDYAFFNQTILGNESAIAYDATGRDNDPRIVATFQKHFPVDSYSNFSEFDGLVRRSACDRAYFIKPGYKDGKLTAIVPSVVHAIFAVPAHEVHGAAFAFVSDWLARFASGGACPYVPHMIHLPEHDKNLRGQLGIPDSALVVGSYGGADCFNIEFAAQAAYDALMRRRDLCFLFMNYPRFFVHPRAIFLPGNPDREFKVSFINSCDAMLHAQKLGESFGLACGEFSSRNKPVMTFAGSYGRSHIEILGDKALIYRDKNDLDRMFMGIDKGFIASRSWDAFSERFSPKPVMEKFREIFLAG